MLTTLRQRRTTWGRRVLGVFAVAWLAVILQPCAMAMGVDEHDCPHCPPAETRETPPCETTNNPDCAFDDEINAEARSQQVKVKDSHHDLPMAIAPAAYDTLQLTFVSQPVPDTRLLLHPSGPPLHVLYCVYLK
ncbi:MAG: hypothetical protein K0U93_23200 [Gammaproteobacteria bacterium]|nr:hypothetical protein [Gammaproteobacteria bacterium]